MSKLEAKVKTIMHVLLESDDFVTLEYLSTKCGVTRRSIQNYIQLLQTWLTENGFTAADLIKKPGRGIRFETDAPTRIKIQNMTTGEHLDFYDDNARRLKMLKAMIFSDSELTIGFLADLFYVSRTVILKDLEWISKWLDKFHISLFKVQNKGIGLLGDEVSKRNAIAAFFDLCMPEITLDPGNGVCLSARVTEAHYGRLQSLYPHIAVSGIVTLIEDAEKRYDFFLTDEYYVSLLTHLTIAIARLKNGNQTEENFCMEDNAFEFVRETAAFMAERIREIFGIKLPDTEITYICMHLMSYSMNSFAKIEDQIGSAESERNLEALAISIIESVNQRLPEAFVVDKILYFEILFHLKSSVYRMKNRIYVNVNPTESSIPLDTALLDAVTRTGGIFMELCGVTPMAEEFHALTMHFMLSKERRQRKSRAVLLNNTGIVTGVLLKDFITAELAAIEIVDIVSFPFQIDMIPKNKYDFIISTVALEDYPKPVADIRQLQKNEYKKFLQEFIGGINI